MSKEFVCAIAACGAFFFVSKSLAQAYPSKPIRIITAGIGGGNDLVSRLLASGMSPALGQQVIVDNRAATITASLVAKAAPDGYTLLVGTAGIWLAPFLQKITYDPLRDLAPISLVATAPNVLVVHP